MDNRECIEKREPFIIFAENVDKFNLGNRTCIPQSESRALEEEGEKMDVRNIGERKMSSRILEITHRMLPRNRFDSLRSHPTILDCTSLYSAQ